jgi:hypothetical protein
MKPKRSILSVVRDQKPGDAEPASQPSAEPAAAPSDRAAAEPVASKAKEPRRMAKKHIGGYYPPNDATIKAFQKLGIDLDKDQQEMLFEAISDYVAKHQAASAFR